MKQEIGTIETIETDEPQPKRQSGLSGGSGGGRGGGNNGRNGGGGGGDRPDNDKARHSKREEEFTPSKYRLAMWIGLSVILMTFAGLCGAYMFIAVTKNQEWKPFDLPFQIYLSTLIILASSLTFEFARHAVNANKQKSFYNWLMATVGLGAAFVSSQLFGWFELVRQGVYLSGNPYAGFFYILTAAHAAHLVGGIVALGYLVLRAAKPTNNPKLLFKRQTATGVVGMYWHSMDGLWLILLALLAFWK